MYKQYRFKYKTSDEIGDWVKVGVKVKFDYFKNIGISGIIIKINRSSIWMRLLSSYESLNAIWRTGDEKWFNISSMKNVVNLTK